MVQPYWPHNVLNMVAVGLNSPRSMRDNVARLIPVRPARASSDQPCRVRRYWRRRAISRSSALVAALFDGHSAFSMAVVMLSFCLLAIASYVGVIGPAKRFAPLHDTM